MIKLMVNNWQEWISGAEIIPLYYLILFLILPLFNFTYFPYFFDVAECFDCSVISNSHSQGTTYSVIDTIN